MSEFIKPSDLKDIFQLFLNIDIVENKDISDVALPDSLRFIYQIKESYNKAKPSNNLFAIQDYLYPCTELQKENGYIDFLEENQGCWVCSIDDKGAVYIRDGKDSKDYNRLDVSLDEILLTYALVELTFILPEVANEETDLIDGYSLDDLKNIFKDQLKPLCLNKLYVYSESRYSFYQIANDSLYFCLDDSTSFFTTTDIEKYEMI